MTIDLQEYTRQTRLLDGAWGTQLERKGLPSGMPPDLWNLQQPEIIEELARSYVEAGSDIILTNTFGANRYALERHDASDKVEDIARKGVEISQKAAGTDARVFASIGPTGKIVMMEEISREDFRSAFEESAKAICEAEPDAIVLETFNELEELEFALQTVKECCDLPVVASVSYTAGEDGMKTMMGNSPEQLVEMAKENGADAIGANCGIGPGIYVKIARRYRELSDLPVWIKPNAGAPETGPDGETVFPLGPEEFADFVPDLLEATVNFIGGCCGTTPDHIREIGKKLRNS
ncbi:MAG: homocysteine S-methyltransferase family protein [Candidatus Brocadiia bacterium]